MKRILPFIAMLLLAACGGQQADEKSDKTEAVEKQAVQAADETPATVVYLQESEPGVEPYATRMIVTPDFLRMDDGQDDGDYLLYDRRSRAIHSVSHEDRTVLDIPFHAVGIEPPPGLERITRRTVDEQAPAVGGRQPVQQKDFVNARLCMETVSAPGLLDDARRALKEYREALAGEQARNLYKTPPELRDPCMLSNLVFHPGKGLEEGFPLYERNQAGRTRELTDFRRNEKVRVSLFELPRGYRHYRIRVAPPGERGTDRPAAVKAEDAPDASPGPSS